jgi:hypothetical protein
VLAPYVVGAGLPILSASLAYVFTALWSPWVLVAVATSLAVIGGIWAIGARDRSLVFLIAGGPLLLMLSMSLQPVLLVRNVLPVAAPLAVAAAAGLVAAAAHAPHWRQAVVALSTLLLVAHTSFLIYAVQASLYVDVRYYPTWLGSRQAMVP